jgi:hypothetical protein
MNTLLKAALSFLTKIPWSTLDSLWSTTREEVERVNGQDIPGVEKAGKVVFALTPHVPDRFRDIAGQVIRLLIEIALITRRK